MCYAIAGTMLKRVVLKRFMALSGSLLAATAVLAATDIPTRYSGSFPSDGTRSQITGTFANNKLTLSFVVGAKKGDSTRRGSYTCTSAGSTSNCSGTFSSGDGSYTGSQKVTITWSAGKPVSIGFSH